MTSALRHAPRLPHFQAQNQGSVAGTATIRSASSSLSTLLDILRKILACWSPQSQWILWPVNRSRPRQNSQTGHHSPS